MADKKTSKKKAAAEADEAGTATEKGAPAAAPKELVRQPKAAKNVKKEKLAAKNKSRLPRRQKKAQKKQDAAARL